MKRILSFLLAAAMCFSIVMPNLAMAYESVPDGSASLTAEESAEGSASGSSAEGSSQAPEEAPEEAPEPVSEQEHSDDQSQGNESAPTGEKSASGEAGDEDDGEASEPKKKGQKTLKKTLKCVDGVKYTLTLAYDKKAEIPDNARLSIVELNEALTEKEKREERNKERPFDTEKFLSKQALEQESFDLRQGLKVRGTDYVLFTKFLDLKLTADGETIQPKAPVQVTLKTDVVEEGASDALEVAVYDKKATKKWKEKQEKLVREQKEKLRRGKLDPEDEKRYHEKVYTALKVKNQTKKDQGTKITFELKKFSRIGVAGVAKRLKSWEVQEETLCVYGPRSLKAKVTKQSQKSPKAGLKKVRAFSVEPNEKKNPDYKVTFWVGGTSEQYEQQNEKQEGLQTMDAEEAESESGLVVSQLKDGKAKKELIGTEGTAAPVAVTQGKAVGVVWDTGLRSQSVEAEQVSVRGLLPKKAKLTADDMLWRYGRPRDLRKDAGDDAETLAAYDITISGKNGEFQPEKGEAVSVSIQNDAISENKRMEVWHLKDNGSVEVISDFTVDGNTISFDANGFSVYMVVQITKEQVLTAGDGNQYKITVTYDSDAGIPEDAQLRVTELTEGKEYDKYVEKAAKKLDRKPKQLNFAHAFDITLVNPETGEHYQPKKAVSVSIRLLTEDVRESDAIDVVHFGKKTEVLESEVKGESVEFQTDGFSVYVVAKTDLMRHYVFMNNGSVFAEQVLIEGESVCRPPDPSKAGAVFSHWATTEGSSTAVTFNEAKYNSISIDEGRIPGDNDRDKQDYLNRDENKVKFYAVYEPEKVVVAFYNQSGLVVNKVDVYKSAAGAPAGAISSSLNTKDPKYNYVPIQDKEGAFIEFECWTEDPRGKGDDAGTLTINSNETRSTINLYPVLQEGHHLYFNSNHSGSTYVAPAFLANRNGTREANISAAASALETALAARADKGIPTVNGYTFKGWYLIASDANDGTGSGQNKPLIANDNGTLKVDETEFKKLFDSFGNLANNPTLYAHWTENTKSSYTVNIWTQKLSDDGKSAVDEYAFQGSFVIENADTGSTITPAIAGAAVKAKLNLSQSVDLTNLDTLTMYNRVFRKTISDKEASPFYGFHYSSEHSNTSVEVNPQGTAVVNIRYDRNLHTLTFNDGYRQNNTSGTYGYINAYVKIYRGNSKVYYYTYSTNGRNYYYYNGNLYYSESGTYKKETNYAYTKAYYGLISGVYISLDRSEFNTRYYNIYDPITVKNSTFPFGANIIDEFAFKGSNGKTYTGISWMPEGDGDQKYTVELMALQSMPDENYIFSYNSNYGSSKQMHYYIEYSGAPDEQGKTQRSFKGKQYVEYDGSPVKHGYNTLYFKEDVTDIDGYSKDPHRTDPEFKQYTSDTWYYGSISNFDYSNVPDHFYFYYDRRSYSINYYDPMSSTPTTRIREDTVKFKSAVGDYANAYTPAGHNGYQFTGWYVDPEGKTTKVYFNKAEYNALDEETKKKSELLDRMPSRNIQLYAGWTPTKYQVKILPNGGQMSEGQSTEFNLDPNEKVSLGADPTRDYVYVGEGEGDFTYDAEKGVYTQAAAAGGGDYIEKKGAYVFLGWYEAKMNPAFVMNQTSQKLEQYTNSKGETRWHYIQTDKNTGKPGVPVKVDGDYSVGERFDPNTPPNKAITIVAKWQRAGGFYVRYNIKDSKLPDGTSYATIQTPEDSEEYIDGAHAVVLPSLGAPKGYALDYWEGPVTAEHPDGKYYPNQLLDIKENLATAQGSTMIINLTARYRTYDPSERQMADYTFLYDENGDGTFDSETEVHELQRIAVNEELKAPITPEKSGYIFKGWYYDKEGTRRFDSFGVVANPVYTTLYALYDKAFTVNYYLTKPEVNDPSAPGEEKIILASQTYVDPGAGSADAAYAHLDSRHVTHPVDSDHYIVMWVSDWSKQAISTDNEGYQHPYNAVSSNRVKSDLNLYAVLRERKYVEFDSQGGSFVASQEIPDGGWPIRPDAPTRKGYDFLGWFTDPSDPNTAYEFDRVLTDTETVLYAHWVSDGTATGKYTVIWWAEMDTGGMEYEFQKAETFNGVIGTTIDITSQEWKNENGDPTSKENLVRYYSATTSDDKSKYFEYTPADDSVTYGKASEVSKEIEENGATVFNVRFHRVRYTLRFETNNKGTIHWNSNKYTTYDVVTWYGAPITDQWPIVSSERQGLAGEPKPWIEITDNKKFQYWGVKDFSYRTTPAVVEEKMLSYADSSGTVTFSLITDATKNESYVHYFFDGIENPAYSQTLYASYDSDTKNGITYAVLLNAKQFEGYEVITSPDMALKEGPTAGKYNPSAKAEYKQRTLTAGSMQDYDYYIYSRNNTYDYYYWDSGFIGLLGYYRPVTVTFANNGNKNAYSIYYIDGDRRYPLSSGSISYVPHGQSVPSGNVRNTLPSWTFDAFKGIAINEKIEVRQRPVTSTETQTHLNFYYRVRQFTLDLRISDAESYREILVDYGKPVYSVLQDVPNPISTEPGMTFNCWSVTADSPQEYTGTMPAHTLVLYATWKPITYTVTTRGVDTAGSAADGAQSAVYSASYNQHLKELKIPNAKKASALFGGWKIVEIDGTALTGDNIKSISGNYKVRNNIVIEPIWDTIETRTVVYNANFPKDLTGSGTAPVDNSKYVVGAKISIRDGSALSVKRKDIDGAEYDATFAYWNTKPDGSGDNYYPNTTFVFREDMKNDQGQPLTTLTLYAVYSQYRETALIYDKNAEDAVFKEASGDNWAATDENYNKLTDGKVVVKFRDKLNTKYSEKGTRYPNAEFPVAEDEDGYKFTVTRTDNLGNEYAFAGWATDPNESYPFAHNGDKAYVNTIDEDSKNTLYAIWGICKIKTKEKDRWGSERTYERVFPTIQAAVAYVASNPEDAKGNHHLLKDGKKTATIEMLIDYKKPKSDQTTGRTDGSIVIPEGCNITLTTAKTAANDNGNKKELYHYIGSNKNSATAPYAVITRNENGGSMFTNKGTFTVKNITLDGGSKGATPLSCSTDGGLVNVESGTLNVLDGTTMQNTKVTSKAGGAIYASGSASLSVSGTKSVTGYSVNFTNCEASYGGAIAHESGTLKTSVTGSSFSDCRTTSTENKYGGGAICTRQKESEFRYCSFSECTTSIVTNQQPQGGAILHSGISGTPIQGTDSSTTIDHCIFNYCTSAGAGGAVDAETVTITVRDSQFESCTAGNGQQKDGGTLEASPMDNYNGTHEGSKLTIVNCTFASSETARAGGAIRSLMEENTLTDCTFTECLTRTSANNKAHGGAVIFLNTTSNAYATISGCEFVNCEAEKPNMHGGAIYSTVKTLTVQKSAARNSSFINCASNGNGGAIYSKAGTGSNQGTILSDCLFDGHENYTIDDPDGDITTLDLDDKLKNAENGGAIYIESGPLFITSAEFKDCKAKENGGAVCIKDASINVTLKNVTINGHDTLTARYPNAKNGGAIFMNGAGGSYPTLFLTDAEKPNAILNCQATYGGAVYLNKGTQPKGSCMELTDGSTISGNTATSAGAGIYLSEGTTLKLSGSPNFGGTGTITADEKEYLLALETQTVKKNVSNGNGGTEEKTYTLFRRYYKTENGTTVYPDANEDTYYLWEEAKLYKTGANAETKTLYDGKAIPGIGNFLTPSLSDKKNGGMPCVHTREDIYIAEFENADATSLVVTGKLTKPDGSSTMDSGSIWVGAQHDAHYKQSMQFATFGGAAVNSGNVRSSVDAENTMKVFRNAYDDETTENSTDSYLYGEAGDGVFINWNGGKGSARVILKKVSKTSNAPLSGAVFTVFKKDQSTVVKVKKPEGSTPAEEELKNKESYSSGVFWIGDLPYGTYYLEETAAPEGYTKKWFYFVLDENFQMMSNGYSTKGDAKTAGDEESTAVSWASKIISGKKSYSEVPSTPSSLKNRVKELLNQSGHSNKVS